MITKLLLVRTHNSRASLLDESGMKAFASPPVNVSPKAWHEEHGLTHYGFELKDLSLEDWQALQDWSHKQDGVTVIDHDGDVEVSLAAVGLRVNESAKTKKTS